MGSLDDVNAALDSLTFTPTLNMSGPASIQIASDDGLVGGTSSKTLAFSVLDAPRVVSIVRTGGASEATNASSVSYTVTFSEAVTGVDTSDFKATGVAGASVNPGPMSADGGLTWTVTVNTGTGEGMLRLDLLDNQSITSVANGTELISNGSFDGSFTTGQSYNIDRTGPATTISGIDISADTGSASDFITATAVQTVTGT